MKRYLKKAFTSLIVLCFALMFNPINLYAADSAKSKPAKAPDWVGSKDQKPGQKDGKSGQKALKLKGKQKPNPDSK
jgi:hypothetical protein